VNHATYKIQTTNQLIKCLVGELIIDVIAPVVSIASSEVSPSFLMESFSDSVVSLSSEQAHRIVSSFEETSSDDDKSSIDEEESLLPSSSSSLLVLCFFNVVVDSSDSSSSR
jgi:hypothetical protein